MAVAVAAAAASPGRRRQGGPANPIQIGRGHAMDEISKETEIDKRRLRKMQKEEP